VQGQAAKRNSGARLSTAAVVSVKCAEMWLKKPVFHGPAAYSSDENEYWQPDQVTRTPGLLVVWRRASPEFSSAPPGRKDVALPARTANDA
jgi:hypothetical protein